MNHAQVKQTIGTVLGYVGLALAAAALAKYFGMQVPIHGGVQETALVAMACLMAR
jgi:uncharacterized membrane protein